MPSLSYSIALERGPVIPRHYRMLVLVGLPYLFTAMDLLLISLALPSLIEEWRLSSELAGFIAGSVFIGMFLGATTWGYLSDRIGRKTALLLAVFTYSAAAGLSSAAWGWEILLVLRILIGFGIGGAIPISFVYLSEFLPIQARGRFLVLLDSFWAYGWIAASLFGFLIIPAYGWRAYFLTGSIPILLLPLLWAVLPRSPRYLEIKGRVEEARRIVKEFLPDAKPVEANLADKPARRVGILDLWSRKYIRRTAFSWIMWFAMVYGYYSFFLWIIKAMVKMGYPLPTALWYNLLTSLAQIPGYFTAAWLVERVGRKPTLTVFLILTAASIVGFAMSKSPVELVIWLSAITFFNLGAWGVVMTYPTEIYPTEIRGAGYGAASGFGRIAGIIGPTITGYMLAVHGLFAALMLTAAVFLVEALDVAILGIETRGKPLED